MNRSYLILLIIAGFMLIAVPETAICQDMEKVHNDIMKDFDQVVASSEAAEKEHVSNDKSVSSEDKTCKTSKDNSSKNEKDGSTPLPESASEGKTNQ